jgi:hypothetical protein
MSRAHRVKATLALLLLPALVAGAFGVHRSSAQSANPGITFQDLGTVDVTGNDWSFTGDFQIRAGAWESLTISNYGYCFVGPNDPREGTAHAAAVYWFGELTPDSPGSGDFTGTLQAGRGGNVTGRVHITSPSSGTTHIDATLSGSDLSFFKDNKLQVCLLGSS